MNNSNSAKNTLNQNIEKCKTLLMSRPMVPMFDVKDIVIGTIGTVVPWFVLLIIVAFIIVV
jgi:hypothetical protein